MGMNFTIQEGAALYDLLADSASDIIVKVDPDGRIVHATAAISSLGLSETELSSELRLDDLVAPEARASVARALAQAVAGNDADEWIEFPAVTLNGPNRWFEIRFRPMRGEEGEVYGALGVMRCIEERRALSDQLFAATYTDPLTRLTNRGAFIAMLEHMLDSGMDGCLAMFSIDFFRTINMQHGQSAGDEVLVVFADLLREMLRADDLISRIGSECFAVLLPGVTPGEAERICQRVVSTLADLRQKIGKGTLTITASASVARITGGLDSTIERAEMALFVAKAKGRNRLEMEKPMRNAAA